MGAPYDDDENDSQTGSVFVFKEVSQNKWELQGDKIIPNDAAGGEFFGESVDIDEESRIVIGAGVRSCNSVSVCSI